MDTGGSTHQQDEELEARISAVCDALIHAPTRQQKQLCALRMAELIHARSPEQIRAMEMARFGRVFG